MNVPNKPYVCMMYEMYLSKIIELNMCNMYMYLNEYVCMQCMYQLINGDD